MDDDTMICPACFGTMYNAQAIDAAHPLYTCRECGKLETADVITAFWNAECDRALHGDTPAITFLLVPSA